ncbi:MAG TPA: transferrin receptor-like dimerization domain-containing protein [Pyrinomonadaceae bacterium]|jgi:N-acetylated-alpha-linked acidic dipeptidase
MRTRPLRLAWALVLSLSFLTPAAPQQSPPAERPMLGFDREGAARERALEARFDAALNRDNLRTWMKRLTARPHHLGSPYGRDNAEFIAAQFRAWGFETQIEEFGVLFPTPKTRVLELTAPERYTARLSEPALAEDATSNQAAEQLPVFNAYSIDGDVTAPLVYVNYGVPRDYDELERRGIDVKGKIVLARYGGSWRGIKPKVAAEHGAVGCLIFSDPRNDGYYQGDVYPKGAFRPEWGAQRGSVADMPLFPGDPLTPGVGATERAQRLDLKSAPTLTKIPVMPISYGDALPLLRALGGPVVPDAWRGALPTTYHFGPGPATVHLKLEFDWQRVPARDVIARLPGAERPEEWIVRGNHHDAWVNGADDPISGLVAEMAEAEALGALVKTGWRPRRSIVYCAWDGEEPGLLGSTEWVEAHADLLAQKAVLYVNTDSNERGFLNVGGSHTLEKFVNEVGRDVTDPQKRITVLERARAYQILNGSAEGRREARERADLRIDPLGSGSDYTPFLQHLGVASLAIGYGGEGDTGGVYHSIYDSFDHYTRFGDPNFDYGVALAQTCGRVVLRFANADVLPVAYAGFADSVGQYVREVVKLADDVREETAERNRRITDKTFVAVADPTETYVEPKPEAPAPYLNFAPLHNALARLQESAKNYDAAMRAPAARLTPQAQAALDTALVLTDRAMLRAQGLPRRPWFRHQIYAPGFYTGYGVKTLPGVREAIEQKNWAEAEQQIVLTAETINAIAASIDRASAVAQGAK